MSTAPKKPPAKRSIPAGSTLRAKPAPASTLRAQTRRVLSKHYRAKYGVK